MSVRVLIVDDEPLARERLRTLLEGTDGFELVGEAADGRNAVEQIERLAPQLVFLDVQMPGMNGFEVLDCVVASDQAKVPTIVFVTAHDRYAMKAFDVHAVDYLLKPFDRSRFEMALEKAQASITSRNASRGSIAAAAEDLRAQGHLPDRIAVKDGDATTLLSPADILWLESADNYVIVHLMKRNLIVRETLASFEKRLSPRGFARVSRSAIVNPMHVGEIRPLSSGEYALTLDDGTQVTSGRTYKESVRKLLGKK